jgi:hypothetical protein
LEKYEVLSTLADRLSGHLAVLRNTDFNKAAFRRVKGWKRKMAEPKYIGIDEYRFGNVFVRPSLWRRITERKVPTLFQECYTTPLTRHAWLDGTHNYPARWFWRQGKLTAEGYEDREFIYLHFMNWKPSTVHAVHGGHSHAPWSKLSWIVSMDWRKAASEGFMISHEGIGPLPADFANRRLQSFVPAA